MKQRAAVYLDFFCHMAPIDIRYETGAPFLQNVDRTACMSANQTNLLQGTLDLLILKSLKTGELHGLGVSRRIDQITRGTFQVKPGSLFPALHRLEEAGWLTGFWGESENNRRARFYRLTKAGERQLGHETEEWQKIAAAMTYALKAT
jgi:PadR family transcriptional regulator, regulatory protein PadR